MRFGACRGVPANGIAGLTCAPADCATFWPMCVHGVGMCGIREKSRVGRVCEARRACVRRVERRVAAGEGVFARGFRGPREGPPAPPRAGAERESPGSAAPGGCRMGLFYSFRDAEVVTRKGFGGAEFCTAEHGYLEERKKWCV